MIINVSSKIILEELRLEHVSLEYVDWLNDHEVMKFTEQNTGSHTIESTNDFVKRIIQDKDVFLFGIFFNKNHIGNIKLGPINRNHLSADISYIIGNKSYWGKGVTTLIINKVCEFGFENQHLQKISAGTNVLNTGSARVLEKNNFKLEGVLRDQVNLDNRRCDILRFGLLRKEFKSML